MLANPKARSEPCDYPDLLNLASRLDALRLSCDFLTKYMTSVEFAHTLIRRTIPFDFSLFDFGKIGNIQDGRSVIADMVTAKKYGNTAG